MKKLFLFVLLFSITLSAQSIEVQSVEKITDNGNYAFANFSPDGSKVLFTQFNFKGLYLYSKDTKQTKELNKLNGAGYQPQFLDDNQTIAFRSDYYKGIKKYSNLIKQNINTKAIEYLAKDKRFVSTPKVLGGSVFATERNQPVKLEDNKLAKAAQFEGVEIENQVLAIYKNGVKRELKPLGDGNYIWPSLSPDGSKILFTFAGKGTYICDLDGKIIKEVGHANYPSWSPDGKWILFMEDRDNHYEITSSEIAVLNVETNRKLKLTESSDMIELYPAWSQSGDEIVFNSNDGDIYLMKIERND